MRKSQLRNSGASTHSQKSGVADLTFENDRDALLMTREFMSYLPQSNQEYPETIECNDSIDRENQHSIHWYLKDPSKPYDIKEVIHKVADDGDFFELQPKYAQNIVTGFIRLNGSSIGVVANQPLVLWELS